MFARHYRLLLGFAASFSLPLAGCGLELRKEYPTTAQAAPPVAPAPAAPSTPAAAAPTKAAVGDPDMTDATIWTVLGFAKRQSEQEIGPQTGPSVSPVLWQAALDTLKFAGTSSEDPITGTVVTKWYSPPDKPNERLRVSVFILSRALRSDSVSITVNRQERANDGAWHDTPVAEDVVTALDSALLQRARQIHAERYRKTMYN